MERFSITEVIEQAIQTEELGYEFYKKMSKRFEDNKELERLFTTLAIKELEHKDTFRKLRERIDEKEPDNWEEVKPYLRAMVESEFFLGNDKTPQLMEAIDTAHDAVRFAINFEKETMLYFIGIRDVVNEKEIVDKIINEEKSHIMWLSTFSTGLSKTG